MLRLREAARATVSVAMASRAEGVADAGGVTILSANCAMKVPSPIMIAAKIIMLRMTPHSTEGTVDITTSVRNLRPAQPGASRHFDEKDERSLNRKPIFYAPPSRSLGLDAAGRHGIRGILRPGMTGIAPAQIRSHGGIAAAPEAG